MQRTQPNYNRGNDGSCMGTATFIFFGMAGLLILFFIFIQPMFNIQKAKNWVETPCKISKSELSIHRGDSEHGPTFYPDIQFQYKFKDTWHVGGQYNFQTGYSSFEDACKRILTKYPLGLETICFVDPENPDSAVLSRDYYDGLWFTLFPMFLIFLGFGGAYLFYRSKNKKKGPPTSKILNYYKRKKFYRTSEPDSSSDKFFNNEKFIKSQFGGFFELSLLIVTVWWNVIIFVFLKDLNSDLPQQPWYLLLAKAIGILLIFFTLYYFIILYNNKYLLELINQKISLGSIIQFRLINKRIIGQFKCITVSLVGIESTSISNGEGGRGHLVTSKFYEEVLFKTNDNHFLPNKVISCKVPENLMCSFNAKNNEIIWKIFLDLELFLFKKIKYEFILKIAPL